MSFANGLGVQFQGAGGGGSYDASVAPQTQQSGRQGGLLGGIAGLAGGLAPLIGLINPAAGAFAGALGAGAGAVNALGNGDLGGAVQQGTQAVSQFQGMTQKNDNPDPVDEATDALNTPEPEDPTPDAISALNNPNEMVQYANQLFAVNPMLAMAMIYNGQFPGVDPAMFGMLPNVATQPLATNPPQ